MAAKKAKTRRSPAEIKKAWQKLEPELAKHKRDHDRQGETFRSITREKFEAKMRRAHSPMILSQGWTNPVPPGGTINYSVGIANPDPFEWFDLAVSVSIGNRNPIASNDEFLTAFDTRFPTYAQIIFSLAPGEFTTPSFQITIPAGVETTGYFGNAALVQIGFFEVGQYLDRAVSSLM
jgi:hypothetical protein